MLEFWKGKRVFVTGHTGFKGAWLCKILVNSGAIVTGYSLEPPTEPSLFKLAKVDENIDSIIGDIRDYASLKKAFDRAQPEIVLHLAAQPIVRESYKNPAYTYETNVMGTVNILECEYTLCIDYVLKSLHFLRHGAHSLHTPVMDTAHPESEHIVAGAHLTQPLRPVFEYCLTVGYEIVATTFIHVPFAHIVA